MSVDISTEEIYMDTPLPDMATEILSGNEEHVKEMKKKKGIRGFFKRTWKALKRPFHHETRVEAVVPPLLPDTPVPCTSGLQQRSVREEVISEPSPVHSRPYRPPITSLPPVECGINEDRDDDDLEIVSISSDDYIQQDSTHQAETEAKTSTHRKHSVKNTQEKHAKKKKKKGIRGFFKRTWKAVKRPFRHETRVEAVVPPLLPDTPVPDTSGLQQRPEREEVISEPSPLCIPYQPPEHTRTLYYYPVNWYKEDVTAKPKKPFRQRLNVLKKLKEKKKRRDNRKINDAVIKGVMEFHKRNEQYSFNRPRPRNHDPSYSGPPGIMGYILYEPSIQSIPEPGPLSVPPLFKQSDGSHQSFYETTLDFVGVERSGEIYDGIRKSDGHKVALKYVNRFKKLNFYRMAGYLKPLMNEVAMLCLMQQPPISPYVIQMFEWFENTCGPVIVLEDRRPYTLLSDLIDLDAFDERTARIIMRQVVLAAKHCIAHGVFYAEIHPRNILVNTSTWEIKLTDFSCALPYTAHEYLATEYKGHKDYASLECLMDGCFRAFPTNVWQLGLLLTELVFGCYYTDKPKKLPVLSDECISLIRWCRHGFPERRPTFDQILQHRWFTLD